MPSSKDFNHTTPVDKISHLGVDVPKGTDIVSYAEKWYSADRKADGKQLDFELKVYSPDSSSVYCTWSTLTITKEKCSAPSIDIVGVQIVGGKVPLSKKQELLLKSRFTRSNCTSNSTWYNWQIKALDGSGLNTTGMVMNMSSLLINKSPKLRYGEYRVSLMVRVNLPSISVRHNKAVYCTKVANK